LPAWEKVIIETPCGLKEAVAPVIVSASRATDIPAFHLDWFRKRLQEGWLSWRNPFNRREQLVSFLKTRAIVFWTKNAKPLLETIEDFSAFSFYVTFSVNDYESERLEPGIPPLAERLKTFIELSKQIGRERVVWRFDPLILMPHLGVQGLLKRISRIGRRLHQYTEKLVFSLADIKEYPAVARRLSRAVVQWQAWTDRDQEELAIGLADLGRALNLRVATCGEKADFTKFGIDRNRCVDDDLIHRAFPGDQELQRFLGFEPLQAGLFPTPTRRPAFSMKDRGQRKECDCIVSKDIGRYGTCSHGCLYCYADTATSQQMPARAPLPLAK